MAHWTSSSITLYIVSDGSYSDYDILGIYSTLEKAEYAKKLLGATNDIEEMTLDDLPKHPKDMFLYQVTMEKDGTVVFPNTITINPERSDLEWEPWGLPPYNRVRFVMWARDEIHAIKIANEKRAQLIAANLWTPEIFDAKNFYEWAKSNVRKVSMPIEEKKEPVGSKKNRYQLIKDK